MKFLPLIWAGLWRKPWRTVLTGLSIAVAFALIGLLQGVNAGFEHAIAKAHREFLTTNPRVRGSPPFPISMRDQIRQIDGVVEVVPRAYFMADYPPPYGIAALATEPRAFFKVRSGIVADEAGLVAMERTRIGLMVTPALLDLFGWKVGDTVTLRSRELRTDGSADWPFVIAGTFDWPENPRTATLGILNYSYLDAARALNRGTAELFYVQIDDPNRSVATAAAIDRLFENSAYPSRTRSDQERAEAATKQMGDVAFFTHAVMVSVLFALLFLTANTIRQSLHERTSEFAVLKAMGFSDVKCVALAFAEVMVICFSAAALGLMTARLTAPLLRDVTSAIAVSWRVAVSGCGFAAILALASIALPSWRLYRLPVAASLSART
jgi:putative ABC transport system permease protein